MAERVQSGVAPVDGPEAQVRDLAPVDAQTAAPDLASNEVLAKPSSQAEALRQAVHQATTDPAVDRAAGATKVNALLANLLPTEENGRLLLDLIDSSLLTDLTDEKGEDCRRHAVGALLRLGFPWALEIDPDTLDWYRDFDRRRARFVGGIITLLATLFMLLTGYVLLADRPFSFLDEDPPPSSSMPVYK